jgi:hypothetical protein
VREDLFCGVLVLDEGNDAHRPLALGVAERVHFNTSGAADIRLAAHADDDAVLEQLAVGLQQASNLIWHETVGNRVQLYLKTVTKIGHRPEVSNHQRKGASGLFMNPSISCVDKKVDANKIHK